VIERNRFTAAAVEESAGDAWTHYHRQQSLSQMQGLPAAESIYRGFA
jgi:hypothetical protein